MNIKPQTTYMLTRDVEMGTPLSANVRGTHCTLPELNRDDPGRFPVRTVKAGTVVCSAGTLGDANGTPIEWMTTPVNGEAVYAIIPPAHMVHIDDSYREPFKPHFADGQLLSVPPFHIPPVIAHSDEARLHRLRVAFCREGYFQCGKQAIEPIGGWWFHRPAILEVLVASPRPSDWPGLWLIGCGPHAYANNTDPATMEKWPCILRCYTRLFNAVSKFDADLNFDLSRLRIVVPWGRE